MGRRASGGRLRRRRQSRQQQNQERQHQEEEQQQQERQEQLQQQQDALETTGGCPDRNVLTNETSPQIPSPNRLEKRRMQRANRIRNRLMHDENSSSDRDEPCPDEMDMTSSGGSDSDGTSNNTNADILNENITNQDEDISQGQEGVHVSYRSSLGDSSEEGDADTIGQLRSQPSIIRRLSNIGVSPRDSFSFDDCTSSPEVTPGAFWQRGRAVGDLPVWYSASTGASSNGNPLTPGSNVRLVPVVQVTSVPTARHAFTSPIPEEISPNSSSRRSSFLENSLNNSFSHDSCTSFLSHGSSHSRSSGGSFTPVYVARRRGSLRTSFRNLFRRTATPLPEAEPFQAEKVVYAIVSEEEEPSVFTWEFFLYTIMILLAGFAMGRFTAPGIIIHAEVESEPVSKISLQAIGLL